MKTLDQQFSEVFKKPENSSVQVFEQYAAKRDAGMPPWLAASSLDVNQAIAEQLYCTREIAQ